MSKESRFSSGKLLQYREAHSGSSAINNAFRGIPAYQTNFEISKIIKEEHLFVCLFVYLYLAMCKMSKQAD